MKQLFTALRQAPKRTTALMAMALGVIAAPAMLFAYGPDRQTYTMEHPADHVTFNSITNNPTYGDEREFVTVKDNTAGGAPTGKATLVPGHTYTVQMYVHNDASSTLNDAAHDYKGIARDTTVRAVLPTSVSGNDTVDGYVSASNATPGTVYDTAALSSNGRVNLQYVAGSATLHTWKQQTKLSDAMFGNGVRVGSGDAAGTDISGNWNGCIDYAGTVTYQFTVDQPAAPDFSVEKMVSKHGANSWTESYAAQPGETVDFRIKYSNTGNTAQNNVVVKDTLPAGLSYVTGTSRLYSSQTPAEGKLLSDNITKGGVNIGNYAAKAWAYIAFSAKVADNDSLPTCGTNTLTNTASVETDNGSKSDTASVTTSKKCDTPKPPVEKVSTCNITTGVIESVEKGKENTAPYSTDLTKCKKVTVCDTTTSKEVQVLPSQIDNKRYTKDMEKCQPTPQAPVTPTTPETPATPTPTELPHTGVSDVVASVIGAGSLIAAMTYYVMSRRALNN